MSYGLPRTLDSRVVNLSIAKLMENYFYFTLENDTGRIRYSMFPSFETSKTILKLVCDTEFYEISLKEETREFPKFLPNQRAKIQFSVVVFLEKKRKKRSDNSAKAIYRVDRVPHILLQLATLFTREIIGRQRVYLPV